MQSNEDNNESTRAKRSIPSTGSKSGDADQGAPTETESSSSSELGEKAENGPRSFGSIWRDGPIRTVESELVGGGSTHASNACHDNGDPDSSAYETNYGDEAQDSSSGAEEGSWSIPFQAVPASPRLSTND